MTVENALYPPQLNTAWPAASDMVSEGDDHIRLTKTVLKTTFPNVAGAVTASQIQLNALSGVTGDIQAQLDSKGAIAGQTWTGAHLFDGASSVTVPTLPQGNSTTGAASTAFVQNEWATRLPNYSDPITASSVELNTLVGVSSPVQTQLNSKGAIAGQAWAGAQDFTNATATAATQVTGDATDKIATTAFVAATSFSGALPGQAGNARKRITTNGTNASWTWAGLETVIHTVSGPMVRGVLNVASTPGITLTVPAVLSTNETVAMMNCTNADVLVDFSGHTVKSGTPDLPMTVPAYRGFESVYTGVTLA